MEHVPLKVGSAVLDIGCGTGATALKLAEKHLHVTALDARREMIDRLRARAERAHLPLHTVVGVAENLPWPGASFDVVIGESVLVFTSISAVLREVRRVMKASGFAVFVEMVAPPHPPSGWHEEATRVYGAREVPTLARWQEHFCAAGFVPSVLRSGTLWSLALEIAPVMSEAPVAHEQFDSLAEPEVARALAEHFAWMERFGSTLEYGVFFLIPKP